MPLDIHERDITSVLCQSCGACCRVSLRVPNTDSRYRGFLREVGFTLDTACSGGGPDCCDKVHDAVLDMGYCRHLEANQAEPAPLRCSCRIYGLSTYPRLCADYNCVAWAKARNEYNESNPILRAAQLALDLLRRNES